MPNVRRSQPTFQGDIRLVVTTVAGFVHRHRTLTVLLVAACCVIALGFAFELRIGSYSNVPGGASEPYQAPLIVQVVLGVIFAPFFAACFRVVWLIVDPRRSRKSDNNSER